MSDRVYWSKLNSAAFVLVGSCVRFRQQGGIYDKLGKRAHHLACEGDSRAPDTIKQANKSISPSPSKNTTPPTSNASPQPRLTLPLRFEAAAASYATCPPPTNLPSSAPKESATSTSRCPSSTLAVVSHLFSPCAHALAVLGADPLPTSLGDGQCAIEVSIDGAPAEARWYDLWGAAVAVVGMCVRFGSDGAWSGECMSSDGRDACAFVCCAMADCGPLPI